MEWTSDDEVQDYVYRLSTEQDPDTGAWETAYAEGVAEHRLNTDWVVRWTTAPEGYDSFGTITTESGGDWYGKPLRKVLIDPKYVSWHEMRYGSGLHGTFSEDPRIAQARAEERLEAERRDARRRDEIRAAGLLWLSRLPDDALNSVEFDEVEAKGISYLDATTERQRRSAQRWEQSRAAEWARAVALVPVGSILVDDGVPGARGTYGFVPGRPPHVYYNIRITNDHRKIAQEATVESEYGGNVGSLGSVSDWVESGRLRVVTPESVPPAKVVKRVGYDRWKEIKRLEIHGVSVWIAVERATHKLLSMDDKGHLVRKEVIRAAAVREARALGVY